MVYEWAGAATLKLNAYKTKAMICDSRDFVNRIPHDLPHIEMSDIPVPCVETAENMGVTIDCEFTWKPQVEAVAKKINRSLYSLNFFRHYTTSELLNRVVPALVLFYFDYWSGVYLIIPGNLKETI